MPPPTAASRPWQSTDTDDTRMHVRYGPTVDVRCRAVCVGDGPRHAKHDKLPLPFKIKFPADLTDGFCPRLYFSFRHCAKTEGGGPGEARPRYTISWRRSRPPAVGRCEIAIVETLEGAPCVRASAFACGKVGRDVQPPVPPAMRSSEEACPAQWLGEPPFQSRAEVHRGAAAAVWQTGAVGLAI